MTRMKMCAAIAAAVGTIAAITTPSVAAVVDFNPPYAFNGETITQDGYVAKATNGTPNIPHSYDPDNAFVNWIAYGRPEYNAGGYSNPDVLSNFAHEVTTITTVGGNPFFFGGISLADGYGTSDGGDYKFTFTFADGTSSTSSVSLANVTGLQAFAFNKANVTSVAFMADPNARGDDQFVQFDFLVVDAVAVSAVPLPAALPLFGAALLALGGIAYGRKRRAGRLGTTATAA